MRQLMPVRLAWLLVPLLAAGCASSQTAAAPAPVATPAQAPAAAPTAMRPTTMASDTTIQPGRFDTGKMWTFENPPLDYFKKEYGFTPSAEWLDHARLAALRLPNCTASFVSANGLIMSNHHCARESASAVSKTGEDLLTNGFYAQRPEDERHVPDLYVDELVSMRDVTAEVTTADVPARDQKGQEIGKRESDATHLRCDVQALYYGGRYSLYCYKRYTDIRLVFVPEQAIGYFGGDPDNFTYPRYDLDMSFFRAYDDSGKPVHPDAYLTWSDGGAKEGDLVFVVGNPGSTSRLRTVNQLEHRRDDQYPFLVRLLDSRGRILEQYMARHPETRGRLINDYFGIENSLKAFRGELAGLRNPELMGRKAAFERNFRRSVAADSLLRKKYGSLWDEIADLRGRIAPLAAKVNALNQGGLVRSRTLATALAVVRYGEAAAAGTPDSALRATRTDIEHTAIDPELDTQVLAAQLEDAVSLIGASDPWVAEALAGRTPAEAARAIVSGSVVPDSAKRAALVGAPAGIATSTDPAIRLMRDLLPELRPVLQQYRGLQAQEMARTGEVARALFDVYGSAIAPDATFTLRIADGVVKGYDYNGTRAPSFTTFYGMYERHFSNPGSDAWALPPRWQTPPAGFDLKTPLDMVMTNDIIGGNSGSPVLDRSGKLVGLVFDGNIESLPGEFIYTDETARSVAVHSTAILEALRTVYGARRIVDELRPAGAGH